MKPESTALASLSAVIGHDLKSIERLSADLQRVSAPVTAGRSEYRDLAAMAYLLHNLYNAIENSLEQISRTFENHVLEPARWHKELLDKMFLDIPGVRPAVLPESLRRFLHELRGFRHLFRHSYDFELDPQRLSELVRAWDRQHAILGQSLEHFSTWLLGQANPTAES
jgi:hypothetical protein